MYCIVLYGWASWVGFVRDCCSSGRAGGGFTIRVGERDHDGNRAVYLKEDVQIQWRLQETR
jgi:hypothetical protein